MVPQDGQLAGLGLAQQVRVDARIRAGDEQRLGPLPLGQPLVEPPSGSEDVLPELVDAFDALLHLSTGPRHVFSSLKPTLRRGARPPPGKASHDDGDQNGLIPD